MQRKEKRTTLIIKPRVICQSENTEGRQKQRNERGKEIAKGEGETIKREAVID